MADKSVSRLEFWSGTLLSAATILVSIWSTRAEIVAEQEATRRAKAAEQLGELSASVNELSSQLESHAGMFVEVEFCLKEKQASPNSCWQKEYSFNPSESGAAWRALEAERASLRPYLHGESELALIDQFSEIKSSHSKDIKSLLPPITPEAARNVSNRILDTKLQLGQKYSALEKSISDRVRER